MGAKAALGGSAAALGDPWLVSKANVLALPVTAVLLYLLLLRFGLMGGAIASSASYFAELSLVDYGLRRKHSNSSANQFRFRSQT